MSTTYTFTNHVDHKSFSLWHQMTWALESPYFQLHYQPCCSMWFHCSWPTVLWDTLTRLLGSIPKHSVCSRWSIVWRSCGSWRWSLWAFFCLHINGGCCSGGCSSRVSSVLPTCFLCCCNRAARQAEKDEKICILCKTIHTVRTALLVKISHKQAGNFLSYILQNHTHHLALNYTIKNNNWW